MFREAANNTFDGFRKVRKFGDRSVGTGGIWIQCWFLKQWQYTCLLDRAGFKGAGGPGSMPPTNRGPPTKQFISYFSLMVDAYETTT